MPCGGAHALEARNKIEATRKKDDEYSAIFK